MYYYSQRLMLEVNNLKVGFKSADGINEAVKGISFTLKKGETISIVGESGSGKSVTSLAIMRLLDERQAIISGSVLLGGADLLNLNEREMRKMRGNRIGMIFQEPMTSLNPVLSCGFQVAEAIRVHLGYSKAHAKARTIELFNEVQLPRPESIFGSYPHQISGGQQQRVMIAMALSCDPEILIADEPTTALDVTVQKSIIGILHRLKDKRQMSMLFISHDLSVVKEIADQVLVMYKGQVVEQAAIQELFSHPKDAYTKGLLASRPDPRLRLKRLPVVADFLPKANHPQETISEIRAKYYYPETEITARQKALYQQDPILNVKELVTVFTSASGLFGSRKNTIKAVDDVSFGVYPGETLGLAGESGCGKTTLGRSILRLIEPLSGSVTFGDINITKLDKNTLRALRKDIQIIFQDPYSSLNPRLTIGESLMEPLQVHRLYNNDTNRKKRVLETLEKVNLSPSFYNRYPHEFSGGQRQRVVIARALAMQPKFIICDESVSALDVSVQAQVLNLLRNLQEEFKLTYIFISHNLGVIKHLCDRMMIMNKGKIIEAGSPDEVFNRPVQDYTKKLIAAMPL